jgi:hypothetical protein
MWLFLNLLFLKEMLDIVVLTRNFLEFCLKSELAQKLWTLVKVIHEKYKIDSPAQ